MFKIPLSSLYLLRVLVADIPDFSYRSEKRSRKIIATVLTLTIIQINSTVYVDTVSAVSRRRAMRFSRVASFRVEKSSRRKYVCLFASIKIA